MTLKLSVNIVRWVAKAAEDVIAGVIKKVIDSMKTGLRLLLLLCLTRFLPYEVYLSFVMYFMSSTNLQPY